MGYSAGVIAGSNPEQIVVTAYDLISGRVRRKFYFTVDQFRAEHAEKGVTADLIDAAIAEARQNVLA